MAQQFGVSRVTVRDALRALEANGLVRVKVGGQGGPYVSEPDIALLSNSFGTHLQLRGTTFQDMGRHRDAFQVLSRLASFGDLPAAVSEETQVRLAEIHLSRRRFLGN